MAATSSEYVSRTPEGGWRISGTRVSLDSIIHAYWQGLSPEAIVDEWPALSLEQVHGAIAFYLGHRDEVDRYLAAQGSTWEKVRQESEAANAPLLERIRATGRIAPPKGGAV